VAETVPPSPDPLLWALFAFEQINVCKVDSWIAGKYSSPSPEMR
jgi:hypothetical protein